MPPRGISIKGSKVKVTRPLCSPPCWRVRRLQRWAWERVGHGKLLVRCRLLDGAGRFGAHGGGEGRGHIVAAARLQLASGAGRIVTPSPKRNRLSEWSFEKLWSCILKNSHCIVVSICAAAYASRVIDPYNV